MTYSRTTWFQHLCRLVLFFFTFATFHPASLRVPWQLDVSLDTKTLTLNFELGTLNFGPTPAYGQSSDPNLAATPDADKNDPFIIQKAQELGNDPVQIFNFVRDEIGYESYKGSLRGARGTLWSKAGNALDQASLMIALLRASNIPARYVQGILPDNLAQQLILSMFPAPLRVAGFVKDGAEVSDPANDPKLLAETREHYWVEFGAGFQAADPTFANAQIGQTFTNSGGTFSEVPDNLRHKVTVRLKRELVNLADQLFGDLTPGVKTVLEETFIAPEVVGKPLTVGHFVNQSSLGFLVTSVTNTYSSYILLPDDSFDVNEGQILRGQDYQEVLTNFPLGSQVLTGVFLEIDLSGPDAGVEHYERTLLDRIGYDVRKNGGSPNVGITPDDPPALTDFDIVTLHVNGGEVSVDGILSKLETQFRALIARLPAQSVPSNEITQEQMRVVRDLVIAHTELLGFSFHAKSELQTFQLESTRLVASYFDRPRLTLLRNRLRTGSSTQEATSEFSIDLRRNNPRVIAYPNQSATTSKLFMAERGVSENIAESELFEGFDPNGALLGGESAAALFQVGLSAGINLVTITSDNLSLLDALPLSAESKTRITEAIVAGKAIIVPERPVEFRGRQTIGWFQVDPDTGEAIGIGTDGGHLAEYSALLKVVGGVALVVVAILLFNYLANLCKDIEKSINDANTANYQKRLEFSQKFNTPPPEQPATVTLPCPGPIFANLLESANGSKNSSELLGVVVAAQTGASVALLDNPIFVSALENAIGIPLSNVTGPQVGDFLFSPEESGVFNGLSGSGVAASIIPDSQLTVAFNGAQAPTAFKVGIKNLGASTNTFNLTFTNVPPGFEAKTSLPAVQIPPGEIAEIGVYLIPVGGLPAPGTQTSFTLSVSGTSASTSDTEAFAVPEIHGVTLTATPLAVNTAPGAPVETTLTVKSVGNVAENVTFTTDLPANLTLNGLSSASLNVDQAITQTVTLTPNASIPLNSTLTAQIEANFGAPEPQTLLLPVRVVVPGADAIASASVAAEQLGNTNLANRLNDLSIALTNLVQNPNNTVFKSQALAALDSVLSQLANDPNFSPFVNDLTAARNALTAANTAGAIQTAVTSLGTTLDSFAASASGLAQHNFEAVLLPNSQVAQPQTPAVFELRLHNIGTDTTTYNVSLDSLPTGVTSQLSQPAVTLNRNEFASINVTLTQTSTTELFAFNFEVTVSAEEAPFVSRTVPGALTVRSEFIAVVEVTPDPPFTDPGGQVNVSARLLNVVNQQQAALVSYIVKDPNGQAVFTSQPVQTTLTVQTSLVTLALGVLNTTGFNLGQHSIAVTVTNLNNAPIPGATGEGSLLIGSPVTATISIDPETLPPGDGMVMNTLQINSQVASGGELQVVGQVPIADFSNAVLNDLALNGNFAYVFANNGLHVVDISNPTAPDWLRNVGGGEHASGEVAGNRVIAIEEGPTGSLAQVAARGLIDFFTLSGAGTPAQPARLQANTFPYQAAGDLIVVGNNAFVATNLVCFNTTTNDVFSQHGDVLSFSIDPSRQLTSNIFQLEDVLLNTNSSTQGPGKTAGCWENGGNFNIADIVQVRADTLLAASSTTTGTNTQAGVGRIRVVDISDPANLAVIDAAELQIPGTVQVHGIALNGNVAFVTATQGGWRDPFTDVNDIGPTGNIVLATVDVTDPRNPHLIQSEVLNRAARGMGEPLFVGNGRFAFASLGSLTDSPQIIVVDASDPNALEIVTQFDVTAQIRGMRTDGNFLYTSGPDGLMIYQLGGGSDIPVTAHVQIPKNTGVAVDLNSFNLPPTQIINDANFDTLVWEFTGSQTVTWQSNITNLQPGEAREVTLDTTVDFVFQGVPGQIILPPTFVTGQHILAIDPATQTARPGEATPYTLTVKNPTAAAVTYDLSVQGIPPAWVDLAPSITVPASSETNVVLTLTSDPFAVLAEYGFVVTAAANGTTGSVVASLVLEGEPILSAADTVAHGIVVDLTPSQATAGQGTNAFFTVRVTNTGSATDTVVLTHALPAGVTGVFEQTSIEVPPGVSNFREVVLMLTPQPGTTPGSSSFTVMAVSTAEPEVSDTDEGTVTVVSNGVDVSISPTSGTPDSTYQLTVKNTGQSQDTFDLATGGPAGLVVTLNTTSVTLAPGVLQIVPITLSSLDFAFPGSLELVGIATSRGNSAVQNQDTAQVTIASRMGLAAEFDPNAVQLSAPGPTSSLLLVDNTGNIEDAYMAEITSTTGGVVASLNGLNGQPSQDVPLFRLPGLSRGAIMLNVEKGTPGTGTVTVAVRSLTDQTISDTATMTIQVEGQPPINQPPVADDQSVSTPQDTPVNIVLTASDPDGDSLSFNVVALPTKGTLSGTAPNLSYTPNAGETGSDSFTFKANDEQVDSNIAAVSITITAAPSCPVCDGPEVVVNTAIKLDASALAGTAGVLAPFVSFDGETITIDLDSRPLRITSTGSISVVAGKNLQPAQFHQAGNHGTPNLHIYSTCELLIEESTRGMVSSKFRSLTGVIETNALGGRAGNILLAFDGPITINGGVQSFQEQNPDAGGSLSGAIAVESTCGDILTGESSWIVTWGENPGSGAIEIVQTERGNIVIDGLVMNRTNHTVGNNEPPIINIAALAGRVTIEGGNLVLDEWNLMGTKYDMTSGVVVISREAADVGQINIQATDGVDIARDVTDLTLNRQNFAAVATVVNSSSPKGGEIRVRSLEGGIRVKDRALQAEGKGDNATALIELVADGDVIVESPTVMMDDKHNPTITTKAQAVNGIGKGGTNVVQSCRGNVVVGAGTEVLASGLSAPGVNKLTAAGEVNVFGFVDPPEVLGVPCDAPEPLFPAFSTNLQ